MKKLFKFDGKRIRFTRFYQKNNKFVVYYADGTKDSRYLSEKLP